MYHMKFDFNRLSGFRENMWMDGRLKAGADSLWGKTDAKRKTLSLYPSVVSFKASL